VCGLTVLGTGNIVTNTEIEKLDVNAINKGAKATSEPLFVARKKIHPKRVKGDFRRLKWIIMAITLAIYYITPFIRWDRGLYAPDQAVLIDMAHRRFYFFFIEIWPQEFIFVAGLLVMAGVGLFLVTSVIGRAWCGYACPQTVWTDLFLVVERFFEGDRNARIRLDSAKWSLSKIGKRLAKHFTWILISILTGGAWIFYFADAPTLLVSFVKGEAAFIAYSTVAILAVTTYFLGGILREQVCIYMCPWPRIQAAMLDEDSLVVTYNDWRGEPKTKGVKKAAALQQPAGDCIDCNACVAVCPTGIDIRDGQQLECITCALCIDACDDIMGKLGREKGLISYATLRDYDHNLEIAIDPETDAISPQRVRDEEGKFRKNLRHFDWKIIFRLRTLIYFGAWSAIGFVLLFMLISRDRLEINVLHDRNPIFTKLSDGSIRNGYTVKILNMIPEPRTIELSIAGLDGAKMSINGVEPTRDNFYLIDVEPDKLRALRVFISVTEDRLNDGQGEFYLIAQDKQSFENDRYKALFEGPKE
jgi:cytochrome c oxidase accessory protein FixG